MIYAEILWVGRRKGKRPFRRLIFRAAPRVSAKTGTERLHGRTAKPVRMGRIGVEGLPDSRRGLDLNLSELYDKSYIQRLTINK